MQVWFEHEGGYDLVNSVACVPHDALGYYVTNADGYVIECEGSCDYMYMLHESTLFND